MSIKPARVQFNGGELSPWLEGRTDIAKYDKTAKLCRNFIPLAEGSLKRRGGTLFAAMTPEEDDILFRIKAYPEEAEIFINGTAQAQIYVSRGDEVTYQVRSDGYATAGGSVTVEDNTELTVRLVSLSETATVTVTTEPADATVKLNGIARRSVDVPLNSVVEYLAYKDGYILQKGTVTADADKTVAITLLPDEQAQADYGDWGNLVGLKACSVVGNTHYQKCLYIQFDNGFLPVIFSAGQAAPSDSDLDESLFYKTSYDMYNAVVTARGYVEHAVAVEQPNDLFLFNYYDKDGNVLLEVDSVTIFVSNWPTDGNGRFILFFDDYTGVVSGNILKVYYKGDLVWELKGRKNG